MKQIVKLSLIAAGAIINGGVLGLIICFFVARRQSIILMDEGVRYIVLAPMGDIYYANGCVITTGKDVYVMSKWIALISFL